MGCEVPQVKLVEVLKHRKGFITIDDFALYKRCTAKLHAKGIVLRDEIEGSRLKTKKQQLCKAGDFLVAEIDAKVGGFGIVSQELEDAIVSSHYFLFEVNEEKMDRRYLNFFIKTRNFQRQIQARGSTNYAAIRPKHVLDLEIPLPSLKEQKRIVARIESMMGRIDEARKVKDNTVEQTSSFWKILSKIARVVKGEECILGDIVEFQDSRRIPLSKGERTSRQGRYPYYGASGIIDYIDDYIFDEELLLLSEDGANLLLRNYPIAFIVSGKYWVNNHAHVIRPKGDRVDIKFLRYVLMDYDVSVFNFASAQPKLNQTNAKKIRLQIPPLVEQRRIVTYLDSLRAKVDELKKLQIETEKELEELVPSILDKAFKGEL